MVYLLLPLEGASWRSDARHIDMDRASNSVTNKYDSITSRYNRMVYLLLPLEGASRRQDARHIDMDRASNSITNRYNSITSRCNSITSRYNRMVYLLLPLEGASRRQDARNIDMDRASNSITNRYNSITSRYNSITSRYNRMVYLLLPLEGASRRQDARHIDMDRASNSITNRYDSITSRYNRMVYLLLPLEGASRRSDARHIDMDRASNSITNRYNSITNRYNSITSRYNRMVYLLLPLEGASRRQDARHIDMDRASNSITNRYDSITSRYNRMVYLLLPLEGASRRQDARHIDMDRASNSITNRYNSITNRYNSITSRYNRMVYLLLPLEGASRRQDARHIDMDRASNSITNRYDSITSRYNRMVYLLLPLEGASRRQDARHIDMDRASNSITNRYNSITNRYNSITSRYNRMVYLLLPLEGASRRQDARHIDMDRASNSITNRYDSITSRYNRMVYLLLPLEGASRRQDARHIDMDRASNSITNRYNSITNRYNSITSRYNRMVYLLLPLEGASRRQDARHIDMDRASNSITNSVAESDSADGESGFEEAEPGEAGNNVIKMVSRFVDKVCTEGNVSADHVRCLHQMIPGVVHMHIETLDAVARESRRLPPQQKPRIISPALIPGEAICAPALRCFLAGDGRESALLPAEGALFLTNYRLLFRGAPTDPFACEQTVVRSFPICSLTREKQIRTNYLPHLEQSLQEGLQLRSATFQLIKVALDEEVSSEQVDTFRKQLSRLRHPAETRLHFAYAGRPPPPPPVAAKHSTLRGFAKKTLLKTARRAGLKPKQSIMRQKYVLAPGDARSLTSPPLMSSLSADTLSSRSTPGAGLEPKQSIMRQKYVLAPGDTRSLTSPPLMSSLSADTLSLEDLESGSAEAETAHTHLSDARTLERLKDRIYARDWQRVGLGQSPFRLSHANAIYTVCRSYPALVAVPEGVSDESLRRIARCYRQGRFPALAWRHRHTAAVLARSAAPHHKGVMGMLKSSSHPAAAPAGAETTSSLEQERYLAALAACTPASRGSLEDSSLSLDSLLLCCEDPQPAHTPLLTKAAGTLGVLGRNSGGKGGAPARHFGRWGSLKGRQPSHLDLYVPRQRLSTADVDSVSGESAVRRASLYVITERGSHAHGPGEHIGVEYPDTRALKHSFKKLLRACVPSAPHTEPSYLKQIEDSGWLSQLRQIFQLSGCVLDLLELQGASVLVALEDGWDATAQICSLAQLCLEPYYRTIEGFRVLVEKEWLAMGHKFQQRSNLGPAPQQGFTPVFLMFLDAVHQLQKQFPLAFEFNGYYTRFVAYHTVSCRFRTFLHDSEATREPADKRDACRMVSNTLTYHTVSCRFRTVRHDSEATRGSPPTSGTPAACEATREPADKRDACRMVSNTLTYHTVSCRFRTVRDDSEATRQPADKRDACRMGVETGAGSEDEAYGGAAAPASGQHVFDYIERLHQKTPVFYNFLYTPDLDNPVLRPVSSVCALEVWEYYVSEELSGGAPYDPETMEPEPRPAPARRVVASGYDNINRCMPDAFTGLLERGRQLELELGHLPQKWRVRWDQLDLPNTTQLQRNSSISSALVRRAGRAAHKRNTLEVLARGRQPAPPPAPLHRFQPAPLAAPASCDHCLALLWPPVKSGVRCAECGAVCHERCAELLAAPCRPPPPPPRDPRPAPGSAGTLQSSSQQYYEQFSSNVAENSTHEGHLYKRGALLKGWKQRWFVLDSIKHQLRYYDAMEDSHCKGFIDLAEVLTVTQAPPAPGPPKKCDDRSFFDLRTSRRTYNFCASDATAAQEWIEKLQACLQ
ncbi:unnamed protein product [Plutella xylostella]|uniref:(diamondback moth) hypothetical protein n=1 Tax=Plutella xylostella TaxID=51655 RepID=A0A8S4FNM6_PLUXY|nr:unnamed protein product [Plutella xylostella]